MNMQHNSFSVTGEPVQHDGSHPRLRTFKQCEWPSLHKAAGAHGLASGLSHVRLQQRPQKHSQCPAGEYLTAFMHIGYMAWWWWVHAIEKDLSWLVCSSKVAFLLGCFSELLQLGRETRLFRVSCERNSDEIQSCGYNFVHSRQVSWLKIDDSHLFF